MPAFGGDTDKQNNSYAGAVALAPEPTAAEAFAKDPGAELEAQQRFERIFRNSPALMALNSLPDRRFLDVNDAFLKELGYSREDVIGRTAPELRLFPHPEQQAKLAETIQNQGRLTEFELEVRGKDGRIMQGLLSGEVIESRGKRTFLTVLVDITARKRVEADLKSAMARLTTLLDNMQSGVLMEDPARRVVFVNRKFCEIFGLAATPADLAGADWTAVSQAAMLLVSDPAGFARSILETVTGGKAVLDAEVELKDGRVFSRDYVPIFLNDGTCLGNMWKYTDITGRKALEKLRLEVAHHVNHELRRPIDTQVAALGLLRSQLAQELPPAKLALLESAINMAHGMTRMVEDLIEVTRSETGTLSVTPRSTDLAALVTDMMAGLQPLAGEKKLKLELEMLGPLPPVLADPERVRQVIGNLTDNAFKFTPEGGTVKISLRLASGGEMAELSVADSGPGLEKSELCQVFDRLYKAKNNCSRSMNGLGLGLYISKMLVEKQGGNIWAESEKGKGSVFRFTLPLWK